MKIQCPPGMRDFYPDDMRIQNWLFDLWRRVSRSFGFQEYEGPIFEFLDLYRLKSGEGIASELFSFQDRGGREFAIRPEMTPTLARMVAARANALPRPIKWFSIPRMCRAEKPQRGRLREFFQWNVDVLGGDDALADAEVIAVAVEFFRQAGMKDDDFVVRVNHRSLAAAVLSAAGIPPDRHEPAFQLIDRAEKLDADEFVRAWRASVGETADPAEIRRMLAEPDLDHAAQLAAREGGVGESAAESLRAVWRRLEDFGAAGACRFDLQIVRGLAYYTGTVFEIHVRRGGLRALAGGGRYDDLTGLLGGPRVPGVGFGMGDAPVLEALRDCGVSIAPQTSLDVFLIDAAPELFPRVLRLAAELRRRGHAVEYSYKRAAVGKQFREAAARGTRLAVVVGAEFEQRGELTVKNLQTGEQQTIDKDAFVRGAAGGMPSAPA